MKKNRSFLLLVILFSGCTFFSNPNSPQGYVRHCIRIMDKAGLYAEGTEWQTARTAALQQARDISSLDEAHSIVSTALRVCGGKHSTLRPPLKKTNQQKEEKPCVQFRDDSILYLKLPEHMGVDVSDSLYTFTVYDAIFQHTEAKGYIIDLRGNTGGNMYPMFAALSPLIPDGVCLSFQKRQRTIPLSIEYIRKSEIGNRRPMPGESFIQSVRQRPIALLTDTLTASSGEATLLAFRGLSNTRTFGLPTAGYASANVPYPLPDNYTLVLTTSRDVARTGEVFCDDPIHPDVETDTPLDDALAWIKKEHP